MKSDTANKTMRIMTDMVQVIADPKDHPILCAAIHSGTDILISGDHHFLDLCLPHPQIMTASQFWNQPH